MTLKKYFHFLMILILTCAFVSCGDTSSGKEQKASAQALYQAAPETGNAVIYAKTLLDFGSDDTTQALAEYAEIIALREKHGGTELIGIEGAYSTKLGGVYEPYDVVKAVERVEDGLMILQSGLRDYPGDKNLQIYYAVTLANLPAVFRKQAEAKKLLDTLASDARLNEREQLVVRKALAAIPR